MKSKKVVLADYNGAGNPLTDHPKRLTKRMRKQFFGKGPDGRFWRGRKRQRKISKLWEGHFVRFLTK